MARLHCPNVVAAATKLAEAQRNADDRLWILGDALIKDCGEEASCQTSGMRTRARNGGNATLDVAARELKAQGITYEANTLRQIRDIAITFKKADRVDGLSFYGHGEANNPDCLRWILKTTKQKEKGGRWSIIPIVVIREKAQQYREIGERARLREHGKAVERMKNASTIKEAREAREEAERLEGMPKTKAGAFKPSDSELRNSANHMEIDADLSQVVETLKDTLAQLRTMKGRINEDFSASFIEDCDQIIASATHIKNLLSGKSNVHNITEVKKHA
jgi:hypothetical protein